MIPRRARIKGIANIPARRKPDAPTPENNVKHEQTTPEKSACKSEDVIQNEEITKTENIPTQINDQSEAVGTDNIENTETTKNVSVTETKPAPRRWVPKPKPMVSIGAVNRRPKPNLIIQKEKHEPVINQNIENENPTDTNNQQQEQNTTETDKEISESINNLTPESPVCISTNEIRIRSNSESDKIPTTPLSPNKIINRTRIRPSPKLIRRNSVQGSASESEDDTRRTYNRIRNDSVCSTASYSTESINTSDNNTKQKMISIKLHHKLFRRSEQSRKVAEARKEFYTKFGTKIPDRKRLTMMDLIYYNPTTNPMPQPKPSSTIIEDIPNNPPIEIEETPVPVEEEAEDDPTPDDPNDPKNDEEEDCNPVPQVKVGPNGEIILDEQSLVIEQTGTKKGREQLANSKVINGDDLNRSYGIYKRPKRAKEWSAIETLRFYRSLNTVGTDFSLMVSLFPGRTRRELKVKFKKEEKTNRCLIDRALTNPIDFDLSDLEKQAKDEEELEARKKLENENKKKEKREIKRGPYVRKLGSSFSKTMIEENEKSHTQKTRPKRKMKKDRYSILENGLNDIIDSESDSEDEYVPHKILKTCGASRNRKLRKDEIDIPIKPKDKAKKIIDDNEIETENNNNNVEEIIEETNNTLDLGINLTINEETREVNIFDENLYEDPVEQINHKTNENVIEAETNENVVEAKTNENVIEAETNETVIEDEETNENVTEPEPEIISDDENLPTDLSSVEPGSLMILQTEGEDGTPVYKVFMVTPDQQKVEVNLCPDVISSLASSLGSDEVVTLDLPVINKTDNSEIVT